MSKTLSLNSQPKCPISNKPMMPAFIKMLLGKYEVNYYYCEESGLLKTEKPYWLDEVYQNAINDMDTGLVERNIDNSNMLGAILHCLNVEQGRLLDIAGGYGLLTRLMRDKGYNCYTTDKYCENLFAKTFEPDTDFKADVLFAFEVLEHIDNPLDFLSAAFNTYHCKTIIFSTLTFTDNNIPPLDWWYYAFEGGQHITFYQPRTLKMLADKLGCQYIMLNNNLHIITNTTPNGIKKIILNSKKLRSFYTRRLKRQQRKSSKIWDDHLKMKGRLELNQ